MGPFPYDNSNISFALAMFTVAGGLAMIVLLLVAAWPLAHVVETMANILLMRN